MHISDDQRRARLARRHLLLPDRRVTRVAEVADALVALHSSDPVTVYLSAALRTTRPSLAAVERALYDDREMVRHHAMRRTIWAMTPQVASAAHAGFTRKIARREVTRTAKLFGRTDAWVVDGIDRVVAVVEAATAPISTRGVGALVPDLAEPVPVGRGTDDTGTMAPHTRLLLLAALDGRIARARPSGTWIGSQYGWVASAEWHDIDWDEHDEQSGAVEIVRRWLACFGPGTVDDLVWWSGGTRTLVRQALRTLDAQEVELDDGSTGSVLPGDVADEAPAQPWVALLPGLDPTAMGWKRREWYLSADVARRVVDRNGNIGPTVWADGEVVGGWVQRADGSIAHDATGLGRTHRDLLELEIERLRALVGESRFTPRFPAPNQAALSSS